VKRLLLLGPLIVGIVLPGASATPVAKSSIRFKPYTFSFVKDGFLGETRPHNRVLIGTSRGQTLRWDQWLLHHYTTAPQAGNFRTQALVGVFLLNRRASPPGPQQQPRPGAVSGVAVTSVAVSNGTLSLTLKVSPYPVVLHGPDPDGTPLAYFHLPPAPSPRYHAFTIVTVAKAAVAHVHRIVVTEEVYDPNEIVVDVPYLPGY